MAYLVMRPQGYWLLYLLMNFITWAALQYSFTNFINLEINDMISECHNSAH